MKYIECAILTTTEASDAISVLLGEKGSIGISIEDPNDLALLKGSELSWDYIDTDLLSKLDTDVIIKGYFKNYPKHLEESIKNLSKFGLDIGKGQISYKEVDDKDWADSWKKYFKPIKVGRKIVIKPSWEAYEKEKKDIIIEIDPGMAFGTGSHETTYMCLELLEKYSKADCTVIDVGCGSGILGIAAAKLGAKDVLCIDLDGDACEVARKNINKNAVSQIVDVRQSHLLDNVAKKPDLIIANIIADIIIGLSDNAYEIISPGGYFISSGIIIERKNDVINSLKEKGFIIKEILDKGEWCAIVGERK